MLDFIAQSIYGMCLRIADPYVKIEQLYQMKRVRNGKRKTTIKRANLNPVYNEVLTFEIAEEQLDETNLLVTVMDWDRYV